MTKGATMAVERAVPPMQERSHRDYRDGGREAAMERRGITDDRKADELRARADRRTASQNKTARVSSSSLAVARARLRLLASTN